MDEPGWNYAEWNKPFSEGQTLYDTLYGVSKIVKLIDGENRMVVARARMSRNEKLLFNRCKVSVMEH